MKTVSIDEFSRISFQYHFILIRWVQWYMILTRWVHKFYNLCLKSNKKICIFEDTASVSQVYLTDSSWNDEKYVPMESIHRSERLANNFFSPFQSDATDPPLPVPKKTPVKRQKMGFNFDSQNVDIQLIF